MRVLLGMADARMTNKRMANAAEAAEAKLAKVSDASFMHESSPKSREFTVREKADVDEQVVHAKGSADLFLKTFRGVLTQGRFFSRRAACLVQSLRAHARGAVAEKVCAFRGFDVGRFSEVGQWTSR